MIFGMRSVCMPQGKLSLHEEFAAQVVQAVAPFLARDPPMRIARFRIRLMSALGHFSGLARYPTRVRHARQAFASADEDDVEQIARHKST
jgi:hypothetical protein